MTAYVSAGLTPYAHSRLSVEVARLIPSEPYAAQIVRITVSDIHYLLMKPLSAGLKIESVTSKSKSRQGRNCANQPANTLVQAFNERHSQESHLMFHKSNSLRRSAVLLLVMSFLALCGNLVARAQTAGAGSITGTVTDPNKSVLPDAAVTVTNVDTGVDHVFTTNSAGIYSAPFLQPGHYKVTATSAGFGKVEATGLNLLVGQTLTIDLTLSVQSATATVEVTSTTPILDVERTEVSQVVDQQFIQNLPVNARNWSTFVLLTPNVTQDGGSGLVSFHGISGLYNQNYVDGANNNQMLFSEARGRASGAPYVYSLDSIKEFQAETSNYSVEFGQAAGG